MPLKPVGRSGISIAPLVLGANVFGWTADQRTCSAILDTFVEAGFNAIDTADVYSAWVPGHQGGESERMIGHWLKTRGDRDRLVIASKVGERMPDFGHGLSPDHIVRSVEASLRRLQTDYIDLYQSHVDDAEVPLDITLEAYDRLKEAGKIRAIGASHHTPERLTEALATSDSRHVLRYEAIQPRFNLLDREDFEGGLQNVCIAQGIGVLCYSALAKGFLTGRFRHGRDLPPSTWDGLIESRYLNDRGFRILEVLDAVAAEHAANVAEIALAWIAHQPGVTAPIIGVETVEQLNELTGFLRIKLTPSQIARLTAADLYQIP